MKRRLFFCIFGAALLASGTSYGQQAAKTYPIRQVRMVVPYPAGGPTDLIARILAQKLSERLDRKSTRLNSSHIQKSRMPSSA